LKISGSLLLMLAVNLPLAAQPKAAQGAQRGAPASKSAPSKSGPSGAFATGRYRNLFTEAGHSQAEVSAKINAAFQQLFHGDPQTQTVYYDVGKNENGPLAYLSDINNKDVRSEGMSYGMMIAVQMNKKAEFDALWNWSKTFMYNASPTHPAYGFFSWSMKTDGKPNSESPAPDGEEYWVMALYFGSARWGDGTGIYDYRAQADRLLSDMKNRGVITGPAGRGQATEGAHFNAEHKMVRFTPSMTRPDHTDPSYHLPAFYELWARWGPVADRPFWADAAKVSRDFFQKATNPTTGLAPDYANFDGTPVARNGNFGADAWRTAANWSVDWSWWAADPREQVERPDSGFLRVERHGDLRKPVHFGWQPGRRRPLYRAGRHQRRGEPGRNQPPRHEVCGSPMECSDSFRPVSILRRHVVHDGAASLQRRVSRLDPQMGGQPVV